MLLSRLLRRAGGRFRPLSFEPLENRVYLSAQPGPSAGRARRFGPGTNRIAGRQDPR